MWEIILLLLVVSVISLLLKPREPFQEETAQEVLDVYKGFGQNFDKTYDALRADEQNIIAETGEFATLSGKVADFESVNVKNDMNVGGKYINLPSQWNTIKSGGRLHLSSGEKTYLLPKNGVVVSRAWGGSGDLSVEGNINFKGGASEHNPGNWGTHFPWQGDQKNYIRGDTEMRGNVNALGDVNVGRALYVKGGVSEHNPGGWGSHFPWKGDNRNYIRGDTEIRGNTNNIGDLTVGRRVFIGATSGNSTRPDSTNSSDPYWLEKVSTGHNRSSLRLTINDDADEVFEIWGNSCGAGNCAGPGALQHRFQANGNAEHKGTLTVQGQTLTGADIQKLKRL